MAEELRSRGAAGIRKKHIAHWDDIFLLEPRLRQYPWGGDASSLVAKLSGRGGLSHYAELWFGSHPADPSIARTDGSEESLNDVIARDPEVVLGERVATRFARELPFLFKVLSIGAGGPLSLQAHPDQRGAVILHKRDPKHYPDPHHKPEMAIAVTPVTLLCGFRPVVELRELLTRLPEIASLIGPDVLSRLENAKNESQMGRALKELYRAAVTAESNRLSVAANGLANRVRTQSKLSPSEEIFLQVYEQYGGGDVGVITSLFLNVVHLAPGEAIFIGPNLIHAYVSGELIECMACSDNVVRAGLTKKYQDTMTLVEMLDYHQNAVKKITGEPLKGLERCKRYQTPAKEFVVDSIQGELLELPLTGGGGVQMCILLDGAASLTSKKRFLKLSPGKAALIPPGAGGIKLNLEYGRCFVVGVP